MSKEFIARELVEVAGLISNLKKTAASNSGKELKENLEQTEEFVRKSLGKIKKCGNLLDNVSKEPDALKYSEEFEYILNGIQHEAELLVKLVQDFRKKNQKLG